jgi:hypothetical protein
VKAGSFPPPFKIHGAQGRAVAWFADEVEAWQRWRRAERDGRAAEGSSWREYLDDGTPDAA